MDGTRIKGALSPSTEVSARRDAVSRRSTSCEFWKRPIAQHRVRSEKENAMLRREKAMLELRLRQAEAIIDIQKELRMRWGSRRGEEIDDNDGSDS